MAGHVCVPLVRRHVSLLPLHLPVGLWSANGGQFGCIFCLHFETKKARMSAIECLCFSCWHGGPVSRAGWQAGRLGGWQLSGLAGWWTGGAVGWQAGKLAGWQDGRLAGWQVGRSEGWQAGGLADWQLSDSVTQQLGKLVG